MEEKQFFGCFWPFFKGCSTKEEAVEYAKGMLFGLLILEVLAAFGVYWLFFR